MKKKIICLILAVSLLTSCKLEPELPKYEVLSDFDGKTVAAMNGTAAEPFINKKLKDIKYSYYNSFDDQIAALRADKVSAIVFDLPTAKHAVSQYPDLAIFDEIIHRDSYSFVTSKNSALCVAVSEQISLLRHNGYLDELRDKWFNGDERSRVISMPDHKSMTYDGTYGKICYSCDNATPPMSYVGNGNVSLGYEIELMIRIAYELNMELEITPMNFYKLFQSIDDGTSDIIGGSISITEERAKAYDFTTSTLDGGVVLVYKK